MSYSSEKVIVVTMKDIAWMIGQLMSLSSDGFKNKRRENGAIVYKKKQTTNNEKKLLSKTVM